MTRTEIESGITEVVWQNGRVWYDVRNFDCKYRVRDLETARKLLLVMEEFNFSSIVDTALIHVVLENPQAEISKLYAAKIEAYRARWEAERVDERATKRHQAAEEVLKAFDYIEQGEALQQLGKRGIYQNAS